MLTKMADKKVLTVISVMYLLLMYLLSNILLDYTLQLFKHTQKFMVSGDFRDYQGVKIHLSSMFHYQPKYFWYYLGVALVSLYGLVRFIFNVRKNYGDINRGQHGTSQFTTLKELKAQYRAVPERDKQYKGKGGIVISRYKNKIFIDDGPVHNLVIGTTRSGKGETIIVPTIDVYSRAENKPSMVINDPKGELAAASYDTLRKRGYVVKVLNLLNPNFSFAYNPLQLVIDAYKQGDTASAQQICKTISYTLYNDPTAKDKYWQLSSMSLFNALALAITEDSIKKGKEEQITMYSIANFLANLGDQEDQFGRNALDLFFQQRPDTDPAKMEYATSNFAKGTTRGSVFSNTMSKLRLFTDDNLAKMTARNDLDLEEVGFGDRPIAIFMVTPDYDSAYLDIASIFVRQLTYVLSKKASLSAGNRCKREVVFLLDEFGNMPPIEDMSHFITVAAGRNIKFTLVVQSYSQLYKLYGEHDAKTIISNCGNQIYLLTNDKSTAEDFSKLLGNQTIVDVSRSGHFLSFNKTLNESTKERPLLTPTELMELKEEESIVVRAIKRTDKRGHKIKAKPIYNRDKTALKSRWRYLSDQFDTSKSINDLPLRGSHKDIKLESLVFGAKTEKDKYGKLFNVLSKNDFNEICLVLKSQLPPKQLEKFEKNEMRYTVIQFLAFLNYVQDELQRSDLVRILDVIKPYISDEELERWNFKLNEENSVDGFEYV